MVKHYSLEEEIVAIVVKEDTVGDRVVFELTENVVN